MLYEYFPDEVMGSDWNIPEDSDYANLPDLLIEIKVCIDWLLKMKRDDG